MATQKDILIFDRVDRLADVLGLACLDIWGDNLVAGHTDGTISILTDTPTPGSPTLERKWRKAQSKSGVVRGPVVQVTVARQLNMLLALAPSEGINAYSLPGLSMKGQAARTRDANVFAWSDQDRTLISASKRRLAIFEYDGLEFVLKRELLMPSGVQSICIASNIAYIALTLGWMVVDAAAGSIITNNSTLSGSAQFMQLGKEVLVTTGARSVSIDDKGRQRPQGARFDWTQPPLKVIPCPPYVVAVGRDIIEVQPCIKFSQANIVQRLPIPLDDSSAAGEEASVICGTARESDGAVYWMYCNDSTVWNARAVPLPQQAAAFADIQEYDQALSICSKIPQSQKKERESIEDRVHLLLGKALLEQEELEEAMLHLGSSRMATPLDLLRPLRCLAPPLLLYRLGYIEDHQAEEEEKAYRQDQVDSSKKIEHQSNDNNNDDDGRVASMMLPYLLSFRNRQQQSNNQLSSQADAVLLDTAILNALLLLPDTGSLLRFLQRPQSVDLDSGERALRSAGRYAELVEFSKAAGRAHVALDILKALSCAPTSLDPPAQGPAGEMAGTPGVWAAVRLLTSLEPCDVQLVHKHAEWILQGDPDAGLEMFQQLKPPLPVPAVLQVLKSQAPDLAASYLEGLRGPPTSPPAVGFGKYDQDLAYIYLQALKDPRTKGYAAAYTNLKALLLSSPHIDAEELLHRLPGIESSDAAALEVRALALGALGRHRDALRVLVHRLKDVRSAEEYCTRILEKSAAQHATLVESTTGSRGSGGVALFDPDIFLLFIQVLLEEERGASGDYRMVQRRPEDGRWKEIAGILSRKRDVVPPLQALDILPGQVPLSSCLAFLEGAVWGVHEQQRKMNIAANLRQAEHYFVLTQLAEAKKKSFVLSHERACCMCHKRLGSAAMVAFPAGTLAHFSCYKRGGTNTAPSK